MKKYIYSALLLLSSMSIFTACDDQDIDDVLKKPQGEFVLNQPAYSSSVIDLENSSTINLTTSQPDYGFTAAVKYRVQVSLTDTWTTSLEQAEEDPSLTADYATIDDSYTKVNIQCPANLIAKALVQLGNWDDAQDVPEEQAVYVRLKASIVNYATALEDSAYDAYSNSVKLTVCPYYIEMQDADIEMWYLIGSCIGDGSWGSTVGTSVYPLSIVKDFPYDAKTGKGTLTSIAYLTTAGFKMVQIPGNWDYQWGQGDAWGTFSYCDGGSGNMTPPSDGYYTITLNTTTNELTIDPYEFTGKVYDQMLISGDFNGWDTATEMTPVNTVDGVVNHIWTYDLSSDTDTTVKFLTDSSWGTNWGASDFPYGYGEQNGANIPVKAGSWTIIFNDIDGTYEFIAK